MFYVYVLKCRDGSFYTGYTNSLEKRVEKHASGQGAKYTRSRLPVRMIANWFFPTKSEAMRFEARFKMLPRSEKMKLIS